MRSAFICSTCLTRISTKKLSKHKQQLLEDLRTIFITLGEASKWNIDISEYIKTHMPSKQKTATASLTQTQLDFIPDKNDGEIDVSRSTVNALCRNYLKVIDENLPIEKKGKVFEKFTQGFFGLIKGWRRLESNANLGDCEVDLIYDISGGPEVLYRRLGDNLYVECKHRRKKSESRDISHFIVNLLSRNLKAGIFFSYSGITGYSPDNWRIRDAGYQRIVDACRQQNLFVIPFVQDDIEFVRNGGNLVNHLQDLVNRFVRI